MPLITKVGKMPKMPPMPKLPKVLLGVDMGYDSLKLALCRGGFVRKVASAPMPKNLLREGRVTSVEAMGEFIKQTIRENGIPFALKLDVPNEKTAAAIAELRK